MAAAGQPYGLDSRPAVAPYFNGVMPTTAQGGQFPLLLSQTGAFTDLATLTPSLSLLPFTVNSPLWSDSAVKSRWMAVPDGQQIGFVAAGDWSFPNGTVFVKNFELVINELSGERKRLETRFLVRDANGEVYGVTYKWRADNTDADLLSANGLDENVNITTASGAVRVQKWSYPSRADCLFCHNPAAHYVLGVKTHQLNGDLTYAATGRTDNQLRTLAHVGLLSPAPAESDIPGFLKSVHIDEATAPVQHRMRSWIDANCSDCHRPGSYGPGFDARFYTPLDKQNLINSYVKFRDIAGSPLYQRDNALDKFKMPPLAKNVVHEAAMANLRQWIASPLEVLSVYLVGDQSHIAVRFNSHVDPATATTLSNYTLDQGASVLTATTSASPDTIVLAVSPLAEGQNYTLAVNDVRDTANSANTIWPGTTLRFSAAFAPAPVPARLANLSTRERVGAGDNTTITGFIVRGTMPKRVMLRALAPSLMSAGLTRVIDEPALELHDTSGAAIASNQGWESNYNRQEISDTGIAPPLGTESAILTKLVASPAGNAYTAMVRSNRNSDGTALLEMYDLDEGIGSSVLNLSSRGFVGTGDDVMIGGFIIAGAKAQTVLLRALGPSLPVSAALSDPIMELRDDNGSLLQLNNDWKTSQQSEIAATGIPPPHEAESAVVRTLLPGNYTAIVRGVNDTTGVALLEVYALQ